MSQIELQVGVKALIKNAKGNYLLLERSRKKYPDVAHDHWDIPGGRIIPGTPLLENLLREIKEETGLVVIGTPRLVAAQDILRNPARHVVRLTYIAEVAQGEPVIDRVEHEGFVWIAPGELRTRQSVDRYVRDAVKDIEL